MEASQPLPEEATAPPDTAISTGSSSRNTAEGTETPERAEDVMIALSLPPQPPQPPRNRSPFSRSHLRSRSLAAVSDAPPPMTRAHSSPGLASPGRSIFANGDVVVDSAAGKRCPPLQLPPDENMEARMMSLNISETISEQAEPESSASSPQPESHSPSPVLLPHVFPRVSRRRPSSPLHFASPATSQHIASPPSSAYSSPMIFSRYNESYPGLSTPSASSMPSTPTSIRSRSPSISSLETIPDIPDAEDAALEADRIAALKAAADKADEAEASNSGTRRRGASDVLTVPRAGSAGYVRADKRKRWSVCGAERRQDLDLETIWED